MKCEHLQNNICTIATTLAGINVVTNIEACSFCKKDKLPMQTNSIVAGITILTLKSNNKPIPKSLLALLPLSKHAVPQQGPGTELKKLISWFIWLRNVGDCRSCYNREQQMNQWGPDECRKNISTIVEWLRESAAKHSIPFSETLVKIIINKAIRNSEKHYEMVRSSNNSTT